VEIVVIDIIFIGIIIIFALNCAVKGFIREVMSLAAAILGALSAIFFFRAGAVFVRDSYMPEIKVLPEIIAFVGIFLIVFVSIKLLEVMLKNIVEGIHLGGPDHVLGFIFGVAEGIIVVCFLLFVISVQPFFDSDSILNGSFFAELLLPFVMGIKKEASERIAPPIIVTKGVPSHV
jgi:membrane protein required for colicin V production